MDPAMILPTLLGTGVMLGLYAWLVHAYSVMWRTVASSYADGYRYSALARKFPEQVVIAGRGLKFHNYVPLTVGIHEKGISLRLLPPFSLACAPLFLPFEDMSCRRTDWFLNHDVFAIRLAKVDVDIIVQRQLWDWLQSNSELALSYAKDVGQPT